MFELFQLGVFFSVTPKSQFSPANREQNLLYMKKLGEIKYLLLLMERTMQFSNACLP